MDINSASESKPPYCAHTPNDEGKWHELGEHLRGVAERARKFAAKFNAGELGYWAGLYHDLGKFKTSFQEYLANPAQQRGPAHSHISAALVAEIFDWLAVPIAGHHRGLYGRAELKTRLREAIQDSALDKARASATGLMQIPPTTALIPSNLPKGSDTPRGAEFLLRMVFSALTDADYLDTEAHFSPSHISQRGKFSDLCELQQHFSQNQRALAAVSADTPLNRARNEIYQACLNAADSPQGIFSLTVPTGGGKTRSAMAFALEHCARHNLDRVIVVIPYTSIIEQTADVYRKIFGDNAVLEHHSQATLLHSEDESEDTLRARLASENWDAPLIVTTTVQLFESLFSNRPSCCRKLHNITRSVLILDEVQTLPTRLLEPILDVLQQLADHYHVTVVLSTATQPSLQGDPIRSRLREVREIIPDPAKHFSELKRVDYELRLEEPWSWRQVAERMRREQSCLAVVNTKADALALLSALDDSNTLHLSTLLCGAHRREVLREVRQRLNAKEPCRLVSTQVVEAGVDLDFPVVLRAMGPLDRIVQAAGRCNREGLLRTGKTIIFQPAEGSLPCGEYRTATQTAATLLGLPEHDLHNPTLYQTYFNRVYQGVDLDARGIQELRNHLDYPTVAQRFHLIEDGETFSVVVHYPNQDGEAARLLEMLRRGVGNPRLLLRRLQPYIVTVRNRYLSQYQQAGLVAPVLPDANIYEWLGNYDPVRGLTASGADPEALVV